jgi:hypothetical protein
MKAFGISFCILILALHTKSSAQAVSEIMPKEVSDFANRLISLSAPCDDKRKLGRLIKKSKEYVLSGQVPVVAEKNNELLGFAYKASDQLKQDKDGLEYWRLMSQLNDGKKNTWLSSGFVRQDGIDFFFINLKRKYRDATVPYTYYLYAKGNLLFEIIYKTPSPALVTQLNP